MGLPQKMEKEVPTVNDLRKQFIAFFEEHGHTHVASAPLLAKDDPSLLFVNSGMVPFKEVFAGNETRPYNRALSCQKCLRVSGKHNDFEQIGQTRRHHTFFEMLGNFSLADYFKEEAIRLAWTFLTERVRLPRTHLWVSVHRSDDEARALWQKVAGISPDRIIDLGDDTNLWAMGDVGPWGYCSEIFMYIGSNPDAQSREEFLKDDGTYLEIWNLVFMQYFRDSSGKDTPLPKPCIDTGMGLERLASVVAGVTSNYDTADFKAIISTIENLSGFSYQGDRYEVPASEADARYIQDVAFRVIADHTRAATFLIADGVAPGSEGESYVLRRLIRRAIRYGQELELTDLFMHKVAETVITQMGGAYPEIVAAKSMITELLKAEEERFRQTLDNGLHLLKTQIASRKAGDVFPGDLAFQLYDTFGFPIDLTQDVLKEVGMTLDERGFAKAMEEQRERSRGAAAHGPELVLGTGENVTPTHFVGYDTLEHQSEVLHVSQLANGDFALLTASTPFYAEMGGQIGDSGRVVFNGASFEIYTTRKLDDGRFAHFLKRQEGLSEEMNGQAVSLSVDSENRRRIAIHHSATHLLNAALRAVLGDHIIQRGSYVGPDRLRFDFSHYKALTAEELQQISEMMNAEIRENHEVRTDELPLEAAKARGALATFGEKYGEVVRVVGIGPRSVELCGGTHVARAGDIGVQLIVAEGSVSSGVRRIEVVAGQSALTEVLTQQVLLSQLSATLKSSNEELLSRVSALLAEQKRLQKEIKSRDEKLAARVAAQVAGEATEFGDGKKYVVATVEADSKEFLLDVASGVLSILGSQTVAVVGSRSLNSFVVKVGKKLSSSVHAGDLVKDLAAETGGKGGGRPDSAFLGGVSDEKMGAVSEKVREFLHR